MVKLTTWILLSLKWPILDMPESGVSPNYQHSCISANDSQVFIEVRRENFFYNFEEILMSYLCILGDILSEDEVLDWLRKNRFRQPELNIFMYGLIAVAVGFVLYTAFLLQCFKPAPPPPLKVSKDPYSK